MTIGLCLVFLPRSVIIHATNVQLFEVSALMRFSFSLSLYLFICGIFAESNVAVPSFPWGVIFYYWVLGMCEAECMCLAILSKVVVVLHLTALTWGCLWMKRWVSFTTSVRELALLKGMLWCKTETLRLISLVSLVLLAFREPITPGIKQPVFFEPNACLTSNLHIQQSL